MAIGKEVLVINRITSSGPFIVNGHCTPLTICLAGIRILERIGVGLAAIGDVDHSVCYTASKRSIAKAIRVAGTIIKTGVNNCHNRIVNFGKVI